MMCAWYNPNPGAREVGITDPSRAALLIIDVQNYNCHRAGAIYRYYSSDEVEVGVAV
jgi:isochorismate hydrolase